MFFLNVIASYMQNPQSLHGTVWLNSPERRAIDITIASSLLLGVSPVIVLAALAVKIEDGGSAFYSQEREEATGHAFMVHKIRTMPTTTPITTSNGHTLDTRATKVGRILRPSRVDEMPQLVSVLKGDMSLIGPRPLPDITYKEAKNVLPSELYSSWIAARSSCRPGIADSYGARYYLSAPDHDIRLRAECDIAFAETATYMTDLEIIGNALQIFTNALGYSRHKQATGS